MAAKALPGLPPRPAKPGRILTLMKSSMRCRPAPEALREPAPHSSVKPPLAEHQIRRELRSGGMAGHGAVTPSGDRTPSSACVRSAERGVRTPTTSRYRTIQISAMAGTILR